MTPPTQPWQWLLTLANSRRGSSLCQGDTDPKGRLGYGAEDASKLRIPGPAGAVTTGGG